MSESYQHVVKGGLKLKGGVPAAGGVKKKKKKKDKHKDVREDVPFRSSLAPTRATHFPFANTLV
jgi:hypothetical protein